MPGESWRVRFRANFAKDVPECKEALGQSILAITRTCHSADVSTIRTTVNNKPTTLEYDEAALNEMFAIHEATPGYFYTKSMIGNGKQLSQQKVRLELLTWNRWSPGFKPFHEASAYRNPSYVEVLWEPGSYNFTVGSLRSVLEPLIEKASLFYAWAGICYIPPSSTKSIHDNGATDLWRPHADIHDGNDIDFRRQVRGAFWFNCLGPGHVKALGRIERIQADAAEFSPKKIGSQHVTLSLSEDPPIDGTDENFQQHVKLAAYLRDLFPAEKTEATWAYPSRNEKLVDGRKLTNLLWLRRFLDPAFLEAKRFQLAAATKPAKKKVKT